MANIADVTLKIYGRGATKISYASCKIGDCDVTIEELVTSIRDSFKDPDDLKLIDDFLEHGDKRFSFTVTDESLNYLELEGQSAWNEPYDSIELLKKLYDVEIYYLVYEPTCEIYETNDMEKTIFGDRFKYALDSNNHYGHVDENTLIYEAKEYYEIDFFSGNEVWNHYNNIVDSNDCENNYFYLLKLKRVEQ